MPLGLLEVFFEGRCQLLVSGRLSHLRQSFGELDFSAIEILHLMNERIMECSDFQTKGFALRVPGGRIASLDPRPEARAGEKVRGQSYANRSDLRKHPMIGAGQPTKPTASCADVAQGL